MLLDKYRIRGGYRLLGVMSRCGLLDREIVYRFEPGLTIQIPIYLGSAYYMDRHYLESYEESVIDGLVEAAAQLPQPLTLIDCGADIGLFSMTLTARCPAVSRVVAFEPNRDVAGTLLNNLGSLKVSTSIHHKAVSDFEGFGRLQSPDYDADSQARYLVAASDGDIPVVRIDDIVTGPLAGMMLKVDVEGGEVAVLRGALSTLKQCRAFAVVLEANPEVIQRTGIDPLECVRLIQSVRPCSVTICEMAELEIDPRGRFRDQYDGPKVTNLICRSTGSSP